MTTVRSILILMSKKTQKSKRNLEIKRLSETISQERMSVKFLSENKKARLIGITNKKNLIFKLNENQVKISPKGNIL